MNTPNSLDLVLMSTNQDSQQQVGKIRIIDNSNVEILSVNDVWKERLNQLANTINQVDEIPVIGGTKINKLGAFTMMETVKKGDENFHLAISSYLKINGLDVQP